MTSVRSCSGFLALFAASLPGLCAQIEVRIHLGPSAAAGEARLGLSAAPGLDAKAFYDAVMPSRGLAADAPAVAANLYDAASKARVFAPFAILDRDGAKILVTGCVSADRAVDGRTATDPRQELAALEIPDDTRLLVVMADMPRAAAEGLFGAASKPLLVLWKPGLFDSAAPQRKDGGFLVPWRDDGMPRRLTAVLQGDRLLDACAGAVEVPWGEAIAAGLLEGSTDPLPVEAAERTARSRAVRLTVHDARVADRYGDREGRCVVVDAEFENVMPLQLVYDRKIPVTWRVPRLQDHVYLIADGTRVLRLREDADALPGHLQAPQFELERLGDRERGNLVFAIPEGVTVRGDSSLELRVYDFAHGHLFVAVSGTWEAEGEPAFPPQANEVLEAAVQSVKATQTEGGARIEVGLRARSRFQMQADAAAFDPLAKKGAKVAVGTVADVTELSRYGQLVADGAFALAPLPDSDLGEAPRFLPDRMTGGTLRFLAPSGYRSLSFVLSIPNARDPMGKVLHPKPLEFVLEGDPKSAVGEILAAKPLAATKDERMEADVIGFAPLASAEAADATIACALTIRVVNEGDNGQLLQPFAQWKIADERGNPIAASLRGTPREPPEVLWLPGRGVRAFDLVFELPRDLKRPRALYAGMRKGATMDLPPLEGAPVASGGKPAKPGEPAGPAAPARPAKPAKQQERAKPARPGKPAAPEHPGEPQEPAESEPEDPARPTVQRAASPEPPEHAAASPSEPPRVPEGLEGVGLDAETVNRAIEKGAAWLWHRISVEDPENRRGLGKDREHLLAVLALLHAEPAREIRDRIRAMIESIDVRDLGIYELSLYCMVVEALDDPTLWPLLSRAARLIFDSQSENGTFNYNVPRKALELLHERPSGPLQMVLDPSSDVSFERRVKDAPAGDNSILQFAMLGLHAASRSGIRLPRDTWTRARDTLLERQDEDGGFSYTTGSSYGSMTCAGLGSLAICRHHLGPDARTDAAIEKGLRWLGERFSVTRNPERGDWEFYYLYSTERVGRLLDTEFYGGHEWYPEGARYLVDAQKEDGHWEGAHSPESGDPRLPTSFALLFLSRATPRLAEPEFGGPAVLATRFAPPAAPRIYFVLDASGSMLEPMDGGTRFQAARDAVRALISDLEGAEIALRVYGHRKRAIERGADEDTELLMPMGRLDKESFFAKLDSLRARGKTPLALSLKQAISDLPRENRPTALILLTDGGDDTTGARDLDDVAAKLGARGDILTRVVGFAIRREAHEKQLRRMTELASGIYFPAERRQELAAELRKAVLSEPEGFEVLSEHGEPVGKGRFGDRMELEPGNYVLSTSLGTSTFRQEFTAVKGFTTAILFDASRLGEK
ncbi:MAG: hypothetical protein Fur0037_19340 [Planctomycetota bacterium]